MGNQTFAPWPAFSEEDMAAVVDVLQSGKVNYWTGEHGKLFEQEFAAWVDTNYGVALANGTVALDAALAALDLSPGDEVIVTPRTFIASASSIVNVGAKPVFADVDPDSQNITAETIQAVLTPATKAIVCVHLAGWPCEMDDIMALAKEHDLWVIEDCAQAHGATYKGRSVGSLGHIAAWSFCQDKIMTTAGEGGMVTTNDPILWSKAWSLKDHGKSYVSVHKKSNERRFRWVHDSIGTNWRMTEMQAVIGRNQLLTMPAWHQKRLQYAQYIWSAAQKIPGLRVPNCPEYIEHAAYKAYVFVDDAQLISDWSRDRVLDKINLAGVPCFFGSCSEVYREKAFVDRGLEPLERLPHARRLGETSLMFLVHPTLTMADIEKTVNVLQEVMGCATGCPVPDTKTVHGYK